MSVTLKVIKSKEFEFDKVKHTHYVTAHKSRVITVSTFNIEPKDLKFDDKAMTLQITGDIDVVNKPYNDPLTGAVLNGLVVLPKFDLNISAF